MAKDNVSIRKSQRLTPGPLEPKDRSISRISGQSVFLDRLVAELPHVVEHLRDHIYPMFKQHPKRNDPYWISHCSYQAGNSDRLPQLLMWAAFWHLDIPWFLHSMSVTMDRWEWQERVSPDGFWRKLFLAGSYRYPKTPNICELPSWDPQQCDWEEANRAMNKAYKQHKRQYRDRVLRLAADRKDLPGLISSAVQEHITWLVWNRVEGLSHGEIVERLAIDDRYVDASTVAAALNKWGRLLGFPAHKTSSGGRPPKVR